MMVIGVANNFHLERSEIEPQMEPFLRQGEKFGEKVCEYNLQTCHFDEGDPSFCELAKQIS